VNASSRSTDVGIVGGGYAGMAAAVALAQRGLHVTVYEAARQLGGRARTVIRSQHRLDNGQHILIGAYRDTLALIAEVGVKDDALLRLPLTWTVHPHFSLRAGRLPAPWHLAVGLLHAKGLSAAARLACVQFMTWAQRARFRLAADTTVAALLQTRGQHADAIRYLWEPLCVAALNTPVAQASAQVFLNVLRDGLASERSASDLLLPRVDLSALFPQPAADYVLRHGGEVRTGITVTRIECARDGYTVRTAQASRHHRCLIVATQPARVPALLGHMEELASDLAAISAMTYQSIVTLYAQYDASPARSVPMLGLSGGTAQWLFDRGAIAGQRGMLAAVISARPRDELVSHEALGRRVLDEIARVHPDLAPARWWQVIEEKRATFACTPGMRRAAPLTSLPRLYLAGDYTEPEYPATLEAAVRSGLHCAAAAHQALASA
jgi:squalene-associated FAD-dependent desaturase